MRSGAAQRSAGRPRQRPVRAPEVRDRPNLPAMRRYRLSGPVVAIWKRDGRPGCPSVGGPRAAPAVSRRTTTLRGAPAHPSLVRSPLPSANSPRTRSRRLGGVATPVVRNRFQAGARSTSCGVTAGTVDRSDPAGQYRRLSDEDSCFAVDPIGAFRAGPAPSRSPPRPSRTSARRVRCVRPTRRACGRRDRSSWTVRAGRARRRLPVAASPRGVDVDWSSRSRSTRPATTVVADTP